MIHVKDGGSAAADRGYVDPALIFVSNMGFAAAKAENCSLTQQRLAAGVLKAHLERFTQSACRG